MNFPTFDNRTEKDIFDQIRWLAKAYTPDWNFDDQDPDVGVVAAHLFASMFAGTLNRSNRRLYNHYLMFLNLLGAKQLPPVSASGMVTVVARKNSQGDYLTKGTPLYAAADNEEGRVYYELTEAMYVADTEIQSMFVTDSASNQIQQLFVRTTEEDPVEKLELFGDSASPNLQRHVMYLGDDMVLQTKDKTELVLQFSNVLSEKNHARLTMLFTHSTVWQFWNGEEWSEIDEVEQYGNGIRLRFPHVSEPCEVMGQLSRFVRCRFASITEEPILLSDLQYGSQALGKSPDILLYNSEELPTEGFFPFSEQFVVYTDFYIGSQEVLYKKGARIDIVMEIEFRRVKVDIVVKKQNIRYKFLMKKTDFEEQKPSDIEIDRVIWEYWNGVGWARLFQDDSFEDFFTMQKDGVVTRTLSFLCPEDIEALVMGPEKNYFIRARLIKVRNPFETLGDYISPYVFHVNMSYSYVGNFRTCNQLLVESDLMFQSLALPMSGDQPLMRPILGAYPAVYVELREPLQDGPIRIFFDILANGMRNMPVMRWQYYSKQQGEDPWRNLEVLDGTENFAHSGVVTIVGCKGFTKTTLFGRSGYFLRVVNWDKQYAGMDATKSHPYIKNILLNTVQVVQRDTRRPEYFFIQSQKANHQCQLSVGNLEQVAVWVNEFGHLPIWEQESLLEQNESRVKAVYSEDGRLEAIWVKWNEFHDIRLAKPDERAYEVDYIHGIICFGDSKHGAIPSAQLDESIVVQFSVSAGQLGNLPPHAIGGFFGSVSSVSAVTNVKPILGGGNVETVDAAVRRVTAELSGMGRMVTQDDFEESLRCCEQNIYRVRCIPHVNSRNETEVGNLAVAILPTDYMQGYEKFAVLAKRVRAYLSERAPLSLTKIEVFEVSYLEIEISADLVIREYDMYHEIHRTVINRLKRFLDPIHGNFNGQGWEIGKLPVKEQIYNYIKRTEGVKRVKSVHLFARMVTEKGKQDVELGRLVQHNFLVPVFGQPDINLTVE